jgi:hypothetical protein
MDKQISFCLKCGTEIFYEGSGWENPFRPNPRTYCEEHQAKEMTLEELLERIRISRAIKEHNQND